MAEAEAKDNEEQQKITNQIIQRAQGSNQLTEEDKNPKMSCWKSTKTKCKACMQKKICCPCWDRMAIKVKSVVTHSGYTVFIVMLILLNSLTLATEHYEQPLWLSDIQEISNIVFTIIFALEMILNMIGLGLVDYFKDGFNIFDAIIVVFSLIDLSVFIMSNGDNSNGFITVLRGFRLLRIFKLVKSWTTLQ